MDNTGGYDNLKTLFTNGVNGIVPVDMFASWCGDRGDGSYSGSAYMKSYGVAAAHPEGLLFDRDGNIRYHIYGYSATALEAMEAVIQQLVGV
jgi:hypothetical protein